MVVECVVLCGGLCVLCGAYFFFFFLFYKNFFFFFLKIFFFFKVWGIVPEEE